MRSPSCIAVTRASFARASQRHQARGLLGWVEVEIDGALVIDSVTVRRTRRGRVAVSFPTTDKGKGRRRAVVRPIDRAAHAEIERQVIAELHRQGRLAS